jgi:hypothetical protein
MPLLPPPLLRLLLVMPLPLLLPHRLLPTRLWQMPPLPPLLPPLLRVLFRVLLHKKIWLLP